MKRFVTGLLAGWVLAGAAPAPASRTASAVGVVTEYSASTRSFAIQPEEGRPLKLNWTNDTKFNGVVTRGAKVTVRYTVGADGQAVARTVGVVR